MKALSSAIVLGVGFLMVLGSPAHAQFGDLGKAVQKGASDAAKQEIMKGVAEQVGLPTPVTPAATPAAAPEAADTPAAAADTEEGAAAAPVGEPEAAPEAAEAPAAGAEVGEPEAAPEAAEAPAATPGAAGAVQDYLGKEIEKKVPKLP